MRKFFSAFYNSLYNASWIKATRFDVGSAWGYFALLILAFALLSAIPVSIGFRYGIREANKFVTENVPDFTAKFENGKLSVTNLAQPYVFQNSEMAIVVDTRSSSTAQVENMVSSSVNNLVITQDLVEAREINGNTRIQSWSSMPDLSFSKADVTNIINKFVAPGIMVVSIVVIFIALFVGFFVSKLYVILMVTIITYIVARLAGRGWKWGEIFTMGLYAITLPIFIGIVFTLTGMQFSYISFIALLAFMLAMVFSDEEKKQESDL